MAPASPPTPKVASSPCRFCEIIRGSVPAFTVADTEEVVAFLDNRPLFPGHVLVVPREHVETFVDLPAALLGTFFRVTQLLTVAVTKAAGADGSFVAMNNRVSQSVAHLHVHVVPRRFKDGLRGFFWPRHRYASDEEADQVAASIRRALADLQAPTPPPPP